MPDHCAKFGRGNWGKRASFLQTGISISLGIMMTCCPAGGSSLDADSPVPPFDASDSDERIVFISNRDRNAEICVAAADGTWTANLTNCPARDWMPVLSPDGARAAFEPDRGDGQAGPPVRSQLAAASSDSHLGTAYDVSHPLTTALPDKPRDIYVMTIEDALDPGGTRPLNLSNDPAWDVSPSWSPDGKAIAFESDRDGDTEICVMRTDGSKVTRLTTHRGEDRYPTWSPTGDGITFVSWRDDDPDINTMSSDGSGVANLTDNETGDRHPSWPPDGQRIAFYSLQEDNWEIHVMGIDGSGLRRLTNNSSNDNMPVWLPGQAARG